MEVKVLKRKDLLGLRDVSREEILQILGTAVEMKEVLKNDVKKTQHLEIGRAHV